MTATVGEEFAIALEANPTAGYQWEPEYDATLIRLVDRQISPAGAGIGSAAGECFLWKALAAGDALIRFIYKRTWETAIADEVVFRVRIAG